MPGRVPPPPLDRILQPFVDDLRDSLGTELVGAYLYGSAVSGGFDDAASDLDVLVVTETGVDTQPIDRFAGIVQRLQAREPAWAGRLDIVFIGRAALMSFRSGGGPFLEMSHDEPLELKRRADEWLQTWYLVRTADWPLAGPAPATLIPPIATDEFLATTIEAVPSFIAPEARKGTDAWLAYRTLTMCRLLRSVVTRELSSKVDGAAWAMERYPERAGLIGAALDIRSRGGLDGLTAEQRVAIPELLEFLAAEVARSASTAPSLDR